MRYGFVNGIGGDVHALEGVLARLRDCDRIVSIGGLLSGDSPEDLEVWSRFDSLGERGIALAGPGERRRSKDRSFPPNMRDRLRDLQPSTVEDGIAILGVPAPPPGHRRESQARGGAPRLVAPLTLTAHGGDTRLWRSAGGLARVSEVGPDATIPLHPDRLWLELGRTAAGVPTCAVIDLALDVLELRDLTRVAPRVEVKEPRVRQRRKRHADERQCLLAV